MSANSKIKAKYIRHILTGLYVDPPKLQGITLKKVTIYDHREFVSGWIINKDSRIFDFVNIYRTKAWSNGHRTIQADPRFTFGDVELLEDKGFIFDKDPVYMGIINTAVLGELGS